MDIRSRSWWGATAPVGPPMRLPAAEMWLHHSVTPLTADPAKDMRTIERIGVERFGRFSYSWAYHRPSRSLLEGAGNTVGAHTAGRNSTSLGLVLIGNYDTAQLDDIAVTDLREAIRWLQDTGRLRPGVYPTGGHRDLKQTACPGGHAYARLADLRQPSSTPPEEDDMADQVVWYEKNGSHAYRVVGNVAKYLPRQEDVNLLVYLGVKQANTSDKPLDITWQNNVVIFDGPCQNVASGGGASPGQVADELHKRLAG